MPESGIPQEVALLEFEETKQQTTSQGANNRADPPSITRLFSFYDNWLDPLIGLRGRLNLSKAFYLTAETDIGEDVGSPVDFTYNPRFKFTGKIEQVTYELK
jgi:hypothetical protein